VLFYTSSPYNEARINQPKPKPNHSGGVQERIFMAELPDGNINLSEVLVDDEDSIAPSADIYIEPKKWDRLPDEPLQWYRRFERYYLLHGLVRSVRRAYVYFLKETDPDKYEEVRQRSSPTLNTWNRAAFQWKWEERADAWDAERNDELRRKVQEGSLSLKDLTLDAIEALHQALTNPRLCVSAAREILDRAGLPSVSKIEMSGRTSISADELATAAQELQRWQEAQSKPNENG
jgi:hypothetical protein